MFMLQARNEVLNEVFFLSKMEIYLSLKHCSDHLTPDRLKIAQNKSTLFPCYHDLKLLNSFNKEEGN